MKLRKITSLLCGAAIMLAAISNVFAANSKAERFTDVKKGAWYEDAVKWAAMNGITIGTGNNMFSPDAVCDRAMCLTMIYRMEGDALADISEKYDANMYSDVNKNDYFALPVAWGTLSDILTEENTDMQPGDNHFAFEPYSPCVRADMVSFLYQTYLYGKKRDASGNNEADAILASMTTEQKIAQMIMPSIWYYTGENSGMTKLGKVMEDMIKKYPFSGVILYAMNITSTEQTVRFTDELQKANAVHNFGQMFIATDQEGGTVSRLTSGT